jgi:hypothetical protein
MYWTRWCRWFASSQLLRASHNFGMREQIKQQGAKSVNGPSFVCFYQVRQGRTWSRSYKSPSSSPPPPSPPTRFRILVFLHFFNFAIFLTTFLTTFWQLFLATFGYFLATFWQLWTTFWQLFWQLFGNFWQLFDNFFWQLLAIFLSTFWQLLTTSLTPNCRNWSPNYSVLVYIPWCTWSSYHFPRFCIL